MMSLIPFWALNVSVPLLSVEAQKVFRFNQKYLNLGGGGDYVTLS